MLMKEIYYQLHIKMLLDLKEHHGMFVLINYYLQIYKYYAIMRKYINNNISGEHYQVVLMMQMKIY